MMRRLRSLGLLVIGLIVLFSLYCGEDKGTGTNGGGPNIKVELETFTESGDFGGSSVRTVGCSKASGNLAVAGLDAPGDWIRVPLTISRIGDYTAAVWYAAEDGDTIGVTLRVECSSGPGPEEDFTLDKGEGAA